MRHRSLFHLKALSALFVSICLAAGWGELIAQEQSSPLQLRHGYRIILYAADGTSMTWDQMQNYNGRLRWEIINDTNVTAEARNLLERGRQAGAAGDYRGALELFEQAHQAAPGWEYPVYESAYTYLLMGEFESSRAAYKRVNQLAPHGFFNSLQAVPSLKREADGEVAPGTYRRLLLLDQANASTARVVARGMVLDNPDYAPAWERVAFFTEDSAKALEAVTKGLAADPDPFTRDSLEFRRAVIKLNDGDPAGALRMLERQLKNPDLTVPVEAQIKILLPGIKRQLKK